MDKQLITQAAEQLKPVKVLLIHSNIKTQDEIELDQLPYELESYKAASELTINQIEDEQSDFKYLYIYKYVVGIRGVTTQPAVENEEQEPVFEITAAFRACYTSKTELTEECAKEFGQYNVGHTVWPYWREYVHSTSARVGLSTIDMPFYTITD